MDIDVDAVMLQLLETQKAYVREDLEDYSCAMTAVFKPDNTFYLRFPDYQDETSKIQAYRRIVEEAKANEAILIITVNSARTRANPSSEELDNYRWGDLDETNSESCILLTASGPFVGACSLQQVYRIHAGHVRFEAAPERTSAMVLNLLPGWPVEGVGLRN